MHEFGLAQEIFRIVLRTAARNGAVQVSRVVVLAGAMRAIVASQLSHHFSAIARGSIAEGAQLVVETIPARGRCLTCEHEFAAPDFSFRCPKCDSNETEAIAGGELMVKEIEIAGA